MQCGAVNVTKLVDRASPDLIAGVATGKHYSSALITFRNAGGAQLEYYKVTLNDVMLNSITQNNASTLDAVTIVESLSMTAAKFKFEYTPQTAAGKGGPTVTFGYHCAANKRL